MNQIYLIMLVSFLSGANVAICLERYARTGSAHKVNIAGLVTGVLSMILIIWILER